MRNGRNFGLACEIALELLRGGAATTSENGILVESNDRRWLVATVSRENADRLLSLASKIASDHAASVSSPEGEPE